jgi:hypothetical protein
LKEKKALIQKLDLRGVVPKTEPGPVKRWSYSAYATYSECGFRFKMRYIDKAPEPPSPAMARGTDMHTKAEYWLQGKLTGPLPKSLQKLSAEFRGLRALGEAVKVEAWWGVTDKWMPQSYGGWLVGKADAHVADNTELTIIDHKSGRVYAEKHEKQASLYSALGAAYYPNVKKINAEFWYLDQGWVLTWSWTQAQALALQKVWGERGNEVMAAKDLSARPGFYCKWCPYSKEVGGVCKAG